MVSPLVCSNVAALAVTSSFVLVLYISPLDRPDGTLMKNRNNPVIIQRRMRKISMLSLASVVFTVGYLVWNGYSSGVLEALSDMGLLAGSVQSIAYSVTRNLLIFMILFIGPILNELLVERVNIITDYISEVRALVGFRNYVFAPLAEEIVYTSCCLSLYKPVFGTDMTNLMWYSPVLFGVAHLNHGWEMHLSGYGIVQIVVTLGFQLIYTWCFGILTNKIFIDCGNIYACIAVHSFCNYMGFPDVVPRNGNTVWKVSYWFLLCLGLYTFIRLF